MLMGVNTRDSFDLTLDHALIDKPVPDMILMTGDITHDETRQGYLNARPLLDPLQIPVHVLPGNHDAPDLMRDALNSEWINHQFQIIQGKWQILMLDSTVENSEGGMISASQLQQMQDCLEQQPELHALICLHHQPVPIGSRWLDTMQVENGDEFLKLLQQYPQVKAVLWGHVHQEFSGQHEHIRLLSTPSTCKQFTPGSDEFSIDKNKGAGYRWLLLLDDGNIDTRVCWL